MGRGTGSAQTVSGLRRWHQTRHVLCRCHGATWETELETQGSSRRELVSAAESGEQLVRGGTGGSGPRRGWRERATQGRAGAGRGARLDWGWTEQPRAARCHSSNADHTSDRGSPFIEDHRPRVPAPLSHVESKPLAACTLGASRGGRVGCIGKPWHPSTDRRRCHPRAHSQSSSVDPSPGPSWLCGLANFPALGLSVRPCPMGPLWGCRGQATALCPMLRAVSAAGRPATTRPSSSPLFADEEAEVETLKACPRSQPTHDPRSEPRQRPSCS